MATLCNVDKAVLCRKASPSLPRALVSLCERRGYHLNPLFSTAIQLHYFSHTFWTKKGRVSLFVVPLVGKL